jgi:hypothetical protein
MKRHVGVTPTLMQHCCVPQARAAGSGTALGVTCQANTVQDAPGLLVPADPVQWLCSACRGKGHRTGFHAQLAKCAASTARWTAWGMHQGYGMQCER